ncbi:hypothetical protein NX059_000371 [Plenodomus lindquistii]|nr:hypothetical protein NX059_000371 [Plenodomus lindquistii]
MTRICDLAMTYGAPPTCIEDLQLSLDIANAKYDLNQFIEDGDIADKQIEDLKAEAKRLRADNDRILRGDPTHPLVRAEERRKDFVEVRRVFRMQQGMRRAEADENSQSQIGAIEYTSLQSAHESLQKRHETLRRYAIDLSQIVEGSDSNVPAVDLATVRRRFAGEGLAHRNEAVDQWLGECGGKDGIAEALVIQASVQPLLEEIGGTGELQSLLALLKDHGGVAGLREAVVSQSTARPLMELLDDPTQPAPLVNLLKENGKTKGLEAAVAMQCLAKPLSKEVDPEHFAELAKLLHENGGLDGVKEAIAVQLAAQPLLEEMGRDNFASLAKLLVDNGGVDSIQKELSVLGPLNDRENLGKLVALGNLFRDINSLRAWITKANNLFKKHGGPNAIEQDLVLGKEAQKELKETEEKLADLDKEAKAYGNDLYCVGDALLHHVKRLEEMTKGNGAEGIAQTLREELNKNGLLDGRVLNPIKAALQDGREFLAIAGDRYEKLMALAKDRNIWRERCSGLKGRIDEMQKELDARARAIDVYVALLTPRPNDSGT